MARLSETRTTPSSARPSICTLNRQAGFTYVEMVVTTALWMLMLPILFTLAFTLESSLKKQIGREQLQMEANVFVSDIRDEIRRAVRVRSGTEGDLWLDRPDGSIVRYQLKKRRVIRDVRHPGKRSFSGTTVLLHEVYFLSFVPVEDGVKVEVGLQNWYADLEMFTFVRCRAPEDRP
jgi:hypothetical protein